MKMLRFLLQLFIAALGLSCQLYQEIFQAIVALHVYKQNCGYLVDCHHMIVLIRYEIDRVMADYLTIKSSTR